VQTCEEAQRSSASFHPEQPCRRRAAGGGRSEHPRRRPDRLLREVVLSVGPLERHGHLLPPLPALAAARRRLSSRAIGDGSGRGRSRRLLRTFRFDLACTSSGVARLQSSTAAPYRPRPGRHVCSPPSRSRCSMLSAAGAPIVASNIPSHRQVASYAGHAGVMLIPLESSPLAHRRCGRRGSQDEAGTACAGFDPFTDGHGGEDRGRLCGCGEQTSPIRTADVKASTSTVARSAAGHRRCRSLRERLMPRRGAALSLVPTPHVPRRIRCCGRIRAW